MSGHYFVLDITESQWERLLLDKNVFTEKDINLMLELYNCDFCKEKASVLAKKLNVCDHIVLNNQIGLLGKRIVNKLPDIKYPKKYAPLNLPDIEYRLIPFEGEDDDDNPGHYYWILRLELENALKNLIDVGAINNDQIDTTEIPSNDVKNLYEGAKKQVTVNAYERNRKARNICIKKYGNRCSACDFDFEKKYGEIGINFIEVHHIIPLHEINDKYRIDPIADLRPVCSNCHSMLHKANITIEQLKKILEKV
jgi:5-methylcytosine-specific restriction protein A